MLVAMAVGGLHCKGNAAPDDAVFCAMLPAHAVQGSDIEAAANSFN